MKKLLSDEEIIHAFLELSRSDDFLSTINQIDANEIALNCISYNENLYEILSQSVDLFLRTQKAKNTRI